MVCLSAPRQKELPYKLHLSPKVDMKQCKLINEYTVKWLRNPLRENGLVYANPTKDQLVALGYLPLTDSPRGEERPGFVQVAHYHAEAASIIRTWTYEPETELP